MESRRYAPQLMLNLAYLHQNYVATGFGDVLREVLQVFREQAQQNLQDILKAHDAGNYSGVEEAAHTLKGSASSVGALRLADGAEELEEAAEKCNQKATDQLIDELTCLVNGTLTAVDTVLAQPQGKHWPVPF